MEERKVSTKEAILSAGEKIFVEKTFEKTTISDIAKAAGLSRGAFYWHFDNKEELFIELIEKRVSDLKHMLFSILDDMSISEHERISKMLDVYFEALTTNDNFEKSRRLVHCKFAYDKKLEFITDMFNEGIKELKEKFIAIINNAKRQNIMRNDIDSEFIAVSLVNWLLVIDKLWMMDHGIVELRKKKLEIVDNLKKLFSYPA